MDYGLFQEGLLPGLWLLVGGCCLDYEFAGRSAAWIMALCRRAAVWIMASCRRGCCLDYGSLQDRCSRIFAFEMKLAGICEDFSHS